jgi:uncharacterized membrane protein
VPAAILHRGAALVCHQRPDRSFHLEGARLPVCARCSGLYAGGALGSVLGWVAALRRVRGARAVLLAAAVPTAVTVGVEWAGLAPLSNAARAAAGLPLGAAAGWVFVRMLRAESLEAHRL